MKYRNLRTGVEIEISGKISGVDWQQVPAKTPAATEKTIAPAKKTISKTAKKAPAKAATRNVAKK